MEKQLPWVIFYNDIVQWAIAVATHNKLINTQMKKNKKWKGEEYSCLHAAIRYTQFVYSVCTILIRIIFRLLFDLIALDKLRCLANHVQKTELFPLFDNGCVIRLDALIQIEFLFTLSLNWRDTRQPTMLHEFHFLAENLKRHILPVYGNEFSVLRSMKEQLEN